MPWCSLYDFEGIPLSAVEALRVLNMKVQAALDRIGHGPGFTFGRLAGTPIESLFNAVDVELSYSNVWLQGRPRLERLDNERFRYNAPPTRQVGRSHRDYQLASDLLRGLARQALRNILLDDERLNVACRNFADGWLFGHPSHFIRKLEEYGSIFGIHNVWSIPISALAAYTAKLNQHDATVDTLFLICGPHDIEANVKHRHRLGVRQSTAERIGKGRRLLESSGGGPDFGGRSMQFSTVEPNGRATLVNASAGIAFPEQANDSNYFEEMKVVRMIFTSIRRLPTSIRGPLH